MVQTLERNPYGAVQLFDGGTPRVISVKARCNISGGYFVAGSSALAAIGSGADTFVSADIEGIVCGSIANVNVLGIALTNIPSGTYGPVAMRGVYIVPVESGTSIMPVIAGYLIAAGSCGTVMPLGSATNLEYLEQSRYFAGRALTTGSGTNANNTNDFVAISLNT